MTNHFHMPGRLLALAGLLGMAVVQIGCGGDNGPAAPAGSQTYTRTNLIANKAGYTDSAGAAATTDASLVNPWGIAFSPSGPFWIADNGANVATIYDNTGAKHGSNINIAMPGSATGGAPSGQIFNGTSDFGGAHFLFSTEDGTIIGWNSGTGTAIGTDRSGTPQGAVYKGLAMGVSGGNNFLFATNFRSGNVDVFDKNFAYVKSFTDPGVDAGFAPFGIANVGGQLFVTFAKQDGAKHDDVAGAGNGFVDVFDTGGNLLRRFASHGSLNSPWAIAQAPASFGKFSNAILIGDFGDGHINAFNLATGSFEGQLADSTGAAITIPGLWGLAFGNGGSAGATTELYFTAGIDGGSGLESGGLFGKIVPKP